MLNLSLLNKFILDKKLHIVGKGKGSRHDCHNYRGITLLSVPGKVFAHVLLARVKSRLHDHILLLFYIFFFAFLFAFLLCLYLFCTSCTILIIIIIDG